MKTSFQVLNKVIQVVAPFQKKNNNKAIVMILAYQKLKAIPRLLKTPQCGQKDLEKLNWN